MKLIKTMPRYRCDYCRHTGIKSKMAVHERVCWRNPQRHCDLCNDKGFYYEGDEMYPQRIPCYYCSQYDATKVPPVEQASERTLIPSES